MEGCLRRSDVERGEPQQITISKFWTALEWTTCVSSAGRILARPLPAFAAGRWANPAFWVVLLPPSTDAI
jgi:hypothetical protein